MSKFGAMRQQRAVRPASEPTSETDTPAPNTDNGTPEPTTKTASTRTPGREGKKMVGAYYPLQVSRALKMLAAEQGTDLQTILGEAIDDLMRKYDKHSLGLTSGRS